MGLGLLIQGSPPAAQSESYTLDPARESSDWIEQTPEEPTGDAAVMAEARRALAEDKPGRARRAMDAWIEDQASDRNPYLPEAYLIRADSLLASGYEYKSLFDYEYLIRTYPGSEQFLTAVEREYDIAMMYLGGLRKRVLGIRLISGEDIAIELLIRVQERVPGSQLAELAAIDMADYYYRKREMKLARDAYQLYLLNFPDGPNRMHAEKRLIYADVARFKGPRYDASGLLDARVRIRNFAARYPIEAERSGINEGLVARIDESNAAQLLDAAGWYASKGDRAAQRYTLIRLVRAHPRTIAATRAREVLDERGWLDDVELEASPLDEDPIILEGPAAEQVQPLEPGEIPEPPRQEAE